LWRKRLYWCKTIWYVQKKDRTFAYASYFHYSECKIIRYYTNHSDGRPAKNFVDYTVDTLVSTTYTTGVYTNNKTERYRVVKMRQRFIVM
jgi:hypothetical protein